MAKISKRMVDATQPETTGRVYVWDDKLSGFGLVVMPSGVKSYCYQYRTPEGQTRRITIGRHGDPHTPDSARAKAKQFADAVDKGLDPLQDKRERRNALTVGDVLDRYLASPTFAEKASSTRANDRGRIERHLKPLLGRKVADKISADGVRAAFAAITAGKTAVNIKTGFRGRARVTGGEGAARMSIRLLKAIFAWSVEDKLLKHNPASGVKLSSDGRRVAVIKSSETYAHLFKTIETLERTLALRSPVADAVRMIALTGARRGEITGLRWRHVDLKKGVIVFPPKEHKTGKKTSEPRVIGLPATAQAILARQAAGGVDDLVFTPAFGTSPLSLGKPWRTIRMAAKLPSDLVLHSLRHSLASMMAADGAQAAAIMAVMGHKNLSTAQRYIHTAEDARVTLAETAAAGISAALTGGRAAKVRPIKSSRKRAR